METIQSTKQRFGIIGNDPKLNRAIEKAIQVAPTDISVLVTGESGVGKENIPKIKSKTKPKYFDEEFTTLPVNSPKMNKKNVKSIDANWNQNFPDYASFN